MVLLAALPGWGLEPHGAASKASWSGIPQRRVIQKLVRPVAEGVPAMEERGSYSLTALQALLEPQGMALAGFTQAQRFLCSTWARAAPPSLVTGSAAAHPIKYQITALKTWGAEGGREGGKAMC